MCQGGPPNNNGPGYTLILPGPLKTNYLTLLCFIEMTRGDPSELTYIFRYQCGLTMLDSPIQTARLNRVGQWIPVYLRAVPRFLPTKPCAAHVPAPIPSTIKRSGAKICRFFQKSITQVAGGENNGKGTATTVGIPPKSKPKHTRRDLPSRSDDGPQFENRQRRLTADSSKPSQHAERRYVRRFNGQRQIRHI